MCKRYFFILFVLKICTFRFANYIYTFATISNTFGMNDCYVISMNFHKYK